MTPYEMGHDRTHNKDVVRFGEVVMVKVVSGDLEKMETQRQKWVWVG